MTATLVQHIGTLNDSAFDARTTFPAPVTAGNYLVAYVSRNGDAGVGTVFVHGTLTSRAFTQIRKKTFLCSATCETLVVGYRLATGDEQDLDWPLQYSEVNVFEVAGAPDPSLWDVLEHAQDSYSVAKDLGPFVTPGGLQLMGIAMGRGGGGGGVDLDQTAVAGWTQDFQNGRPDPFGHIFDTSQWAGHATSGPEARIDGGNATAFAGVALGIGASDLGCAFSADPSSGDAPLTVAFTDLTTGGPDSWLWDFGDGDTSTDQNPSHDYLVPGSYDVTLSTTRSLDGATCTTTVVGAVTVLQPATAWDVYARDDPNGPIIATLDNASDRFFRAAEDDEGAGGFRIAKSAPEARADVLAKGNIVKVRIPQISDDYIFAFILERGDFTVLSSNEEGGELLEFGGRGVLAYLDRAIMWNVAYTTGLDISDTWTEVWSTNRVKKPSGVWYDPTDSGYVRVIDEITRRLYKINQTTRAVTTLSGALFSHYAGGLSGDPADATIYWALEAPWLSGSGADSYIHKVRKSDNHVLASYNIGSSHWTDIRSDGTVLFLTNYSDGKVYRKSRASGATVSSFHISYKGVTQTGPNAVSINGTSIAYWFDNGSSSGAKRALIADTSAPTVITRVISTQSIASFGGEWTTESSQDYFYMVSYTLGRTWKYQVTAATPHDPVSGIWRLDEATPGAILWRIIQECQAVGRPQQPIPDLTYAFDSTTDSLGNDWHTHVGTTEFDANVGDSVFSTSLRLIPYALKLQMSPDLVLGAYNAYGTDRSSATFAAGKVRFEVGVNIATEARKSLAAPGVHSHLLAQGDGPIYAIGTDDDLGFVQEGFLATQLKDAASLAGTATAALADERQLADSVPLAVLWGDDELAGLYLPGPPGTNGHYWVGDTVRVHTGTEETDLNEENIAIAAVTLSETETGEWEPVLELASSRITTAWLGSQNSASSGSGSTGGGGSGTTTHTAAISLRDTTGGVTLTGIQELTSADWVIIETTAGEALFAIRWPDLDQLADVDTSDLADRFGLVWDDASSAWLPRLAFPWGGLTPAQITAATNDYGPAGMGQVTRLRLSTDASRRVTGLAAPTDAEAQAHVIVNVGAFDLVLGDADTGSAAANRILCGGSDITLEPDMAVLVLYDPDADSGTGRWQVVGGAGGGGASLAVQQGGVDVVNPASGINGGHGVLFTDQGAGVAGLAVNEADLTGSLLPVARGASPIEIAYTFSATTTDSDPGSGVCRISNATEYLGVTWRLDLLDANGVDVTALLDLITAYAAADGTYGRIRMQHAKDPSKWLVASVSAMASPSGYRNVTVANIAKSSNSPFAGGDPVYVVFEPAGAVGIGYLDEGDTGASLSFSFTRAVHRFRLTAASVTLSPTSVPASGTFGLVRGLVVQDGTGGRLLTGTWWSSITWVGGSPVLQTAPGAIDEFDVWTTDGGSTYFGIFAIRAITPTVASSASGLLYAAASFR